VNTYFEDASSTIHMGDALEILSTMKAGSVDLVVTDPPYVIGAVSAGNIGSKAGGWGDMMNSSRWFRDWYVMVRRLLKQDGAMWTFCNWRSLPVVMKAAIDAEWSVTSLLVWDKQWIGPGGVVGLRPSYELVALLAMPEFAIPDRGVPDIWQQQWASHKPTGHPAEKPVALLSRLIDTSGVKDGVVLDPFMGSGSTLRAAKDCGLRGVGIEAEERWCEVAKGRLAQQTLPLLTEATT
jgi:DNA modification methylase